MVPDRTCSRRAIALGRDGGKVTRRLAAVQAQAQSGNGLVDRLRPRRSR